MEQRLVTLLIPGDTDFPPAGSIGLAAALAVHGRFSLPLRAVTDRLPEGFADAPDTEAVAMLKRVEAEHPARFSALVVGAYSLYYTHPKVAAVIERLTGHTARPPQPEGHRLPPFDPAMVAVPAARPPLYRPTPESDP